ncbi:MAG: helix-turn-helix transcriptional regulator [Cellulosilyticum sp.]|nr:helix-turn-helix transcriptional regulator [Cellulosilyticum sp.]
MQGIIFTIKLNFSPLLHISLFCDIFYLEDITNQGGSPLNFYNNIPLKSAPSSYTLQPINAYANEFYFPGKFSLIFFENGSGCGKINDTSFNFMGPGIICLNQSERLILTKSYNLKGYILCFTPNLLQEYFTFENIITFDHCFTPHDINIALNLSIFYHRFPHYIGHTPISEPLLKQLYKSLDHLTRCSDSVDSMSSIITDIITPIKRVVQSNLSVSRVITTPTSFEVKDVIMYLHANCKQKITIPKLSKQFHINRTTLSDRFFEATGETIITYLNKYRINVAAIMLRESNYSISNIAEEVGFNDTAYFAKLFKKYMFHTPSGYRQRYLSLFHVHKTDN